jgi:hypothetical protein
MTRWLTLTAVLAMIATATPATAAPCPGNRQALGTSRGVDGREPDKWRGGEMEL